MRETLERTVNVVDLVAPVLTLNSSDIISLEQGSLYTKLCATAHNNVDGVIIVGAPVGSIQHNNIGQYLLTCSITDEENNGSMVVRTINVVMSKAFITRWKIDNPVISADD